MRILSPVAPTPEQLPILLDGKPGVVLVKGAAGSGKTTTALMRLKQLCASWLSRRQRLGLAGPVRVLVLTYNRTLEGYIAELASQQVPDDPNLHLEVRTFGKWASDLVGRANILDRDQQLRLLRPLIQELGIDQEFLIDEVDYVLSRFEPDDLDAYVGTQRIGRGIAPRMDVGRRQRLLREVIYPYVEIKKRQNVFDWNDIAIRAAGEIAEKWDVVVVDEGQDFSANQIRTILRHVAGQAFSVTFVMDAAQRIYPRFFTWKEVGITLAGVYTLKHNYRNTHEIAAFARPLVEGIPLEDDGALPDFNATQQRGSLPTVVTGTYSSQIKHMVNFIVNEVDLVSESVAFLQPRGGAWFSCLENYLRQVGLKWVRLTRASVWPRGTEAIAICTLHSAKGLEFDHVFLPGLNQEVTPHGGEDGDAQLEALRRLVAMGVGRARKTLMVGYKPDEASTIVKLFQQGTYELVKK